MVYVLDTNIVLLSMGNVAFDTYFVEAYQPARYDVVISAVTEGELLSIALQRNWGHSKRQQLGAVLQRLIIYPVKVRDVMEAYAEIDAYSQGKLLSNPLPSGMTARNMGKNDLWIAATAHVVDARLLTTDQDFSHLNDVYCAVDTIDVAQFK